jgi:large subunit ribosomal protein L23
VTPLTPQDIVLRPLVTEKTLRLAERLNAYTFQVRRECNKIQIKDAVESLFKVGVVEVRTANHLGKFKRFGRSYGRRPDWKKAVVQVRTGDTIEFY